MSTRKAFKRKAAPHETPPPAVCGRLHVAVAESEQLTAAGGGSSSFSDTCRSITPEYAEEAQSWDPDEIRAAAS